MPVFVSGRDQPEFAGLLHQGLVLLQPPPVIPILGARDHGDGLDSGRFFLQCKGFGLLFRPGSAGQSCQDVQDFGVEGGILRDVRKTGEHDRDFRPRLQCVFVGLFESAVFLMDRCGYCKSLGQCRTKMRKFAIPPHQISKLRGSVIEQAENFVASCTLGHQPSEAGFDPGVIEIDLGEGESFKSIQKDARAGQGFP